MTQKIAIATDDGVTISKHLGQARYFQVVTIEGDAAVNSELREKARHDHQHGHSADDAGAHPGQAMLEAIADCQVLIAGGMGQPMFARASARGMQVILTGEERVEEAVARFIAGDLPSDARRVHQH